MGESEWINEILDALNRNKHVTWFFETKNPERYFEFLDRIPRNSVLSATIETNRDYETWNAPSRGKRIKTMIDLKWEKKHISIEPIMDFDVDIMVETIKHIDPVLVSVGYDNYHAGLVEPELEKTNDLIAKLEGFVKVEKKEVREKCEKPFARMK